MDSPRFGSTTIEEFNTRRKNVNAVNTQKANARAANTFRGYLIEKGNLKVDFENFSQSELNEVLRLFYLDIRKVDGGKYKTSSLENLRHSLNRYLNYTSQLDIIKDKEFTDANLSYRTMLTELKKEGLGITKHYPVINSTDLDKLYQSYLFNVDIPTGLMNKVHFEIRLYFMRRGAENMHKMTKATFQIFRDPESGLTYVKKAVDEMTKNHREDNKENCGDGCMPEMPGNPICPVASFESYLNKLNPNCDRLWQRPKSSFLPEESYWYTNSPIGEKKLQQFMPSLSEKCMLSKRYTNHSIRATGATILSQKMFSPAQIMSVSGHKSVSSLTVYQRVNESEKNNMGQAINNYIHPNEIQVVKKSDNTSNINPLHHEFNDLVLEDLALDDFINQHQPTLPIFYKCSNITVNINK